MAIFHLDINNLLRMIQTFGTFRHSPLGPKPEYFKSCLAELHWIFTVLNILGLVAGLGLYLFYGEHRDPLTQMKVLSEIIASVEGLLNSFMCGLLHLPLKTLLTKIKEFLKTATAQEKVILQKYIDRYLLLWTCIWVSTYGCGLSFAVSPIFLHTEYPTDVWYPIPKDMPLIKYIVYVLQVIAIYQVDSTIYTYYIIALLFWYPTARLEMLKLDLQVVVNRYQLRECITKHQEIILFSEEAHRTIRGIVLKTNATMGLTAIFGGLPLLGGPPFIIACQYVSMVLAVLPRIYVLAWPADDLKLMSEEMSLCAYDTPWITKSKEMGSSVRIMMQRSMKPITLTFGFIPALSLNYYGNFIKTLASYFMTARAVIGA